MRYCDNSTVQLKGRSPIVGGGCLNAEATKSVIVTYNEVEDDTLFLCPGCAKIVARGARKHGYSVRIEPLS